MGKPATIFLFYAAVLALLVSSAPDTALPEMTHSLDHWFKTVNPKKSTVTKLQLYIHASFAISENQTVFEVATAEITPTSPSNFGRILVIDNPLTTGLHPDSQSLGHYQGMNAYSDFSVAAANMNMNIIFSGGDYDGSTISIMGRQPVLEEVRPMSVIGGTGVFRFAKGIVLASTYSLDPESKIGTYVYNMYVITPAAAAAEVVHVA